MGDVFDNLIGLIPVVLGILWVLRRVSRGSRKKQEADRTTASGDKDGAGIRSRRLNPRTSSQGFSPERSGREKTLKTVLARVAEFTESMQEGNTVSSAPFPGGANVVRRPEVSRSHSSEAIEPAKDDITISGMEVSKGPTTLERISGLPPLAQGVLWSTILDKPVGMKDPKESFR